MTEFFEKNRNWINAQLVEPLYNESLVDNEHFLYPSKVIKYMKKNLDITKPRYSEEILAVP